MDNDCFSERNVTIFLMMILGLVAIMWFMAAMKDDGTGIKTSEGFYEKFAAVDDKAQQNKLPVIDVQTGILLDGPGFEKDDRKGGLEGVLEGVHGRIPSNFYFLDDGVDGNAGLQNNICSPACCATQWPVPFMTETNAQICENTDNFVKSQYMCQNDSGSGQSGCMCITKDQRNFLMSRGGNGTFI